MPRKFQDNQPVAVYYASRRMHTDFFGVIESYENGKYKVRYLGGEITPKTDLIFDCKVHELRQVSNSFIDSMKGKLTQAHSQMLRSWCENHGNMGWRWTQTNLVWQSFAVQRLMDMQFHRHFPLTDVIGRTSRVYY